MRRQGERKSNEEKEEATREGVQERKRVVAPPSNKENPIDKSDGAVAVFSFPFLHCTKKKKKKKKALFSCC